MNFRRLGWVPPSHPSSAPSLTVGQQRDRWAPTGSRRRVSRRLFHLLPCWGWAAGVVADRSDGVVKVRVVPLVRLLVARPM